MKNVILLILIHCVIFTCQTQEIDDTAKKNKGAISGQVTLQNETDHSGVAVTVTGKDLSSESTSTGAYLISDVPSGTYSIVLSKTGFVSQTIDYIEVKGDLTTMVEAVELLLE
jgi:hypothetical protein